MPIIEFKPPNEEIMKSQENNLELLKAENNDLKERAKVNIIIFQQKLAEQERKYQAELETWKMAELNRSLYEQALDKNTMINYRASSLRTELFRTEPQCDLKNIQTQNQPIIKRFKNSIPSITNSVHPSSSSSSNLSKNSAFLSADNYYQSNIEIKNNEDSNGEKYFDSGMNKTTQYTGDKKMKCSTNANKKRKLFNTKENLL